MAAGNTLQNGMAHTHTETDRHTHTHTQTHCDTDLEGEGRRRGEHIAERDGTHRVHTHRHTHTLTLTWNVKGVAAGNTLRNGMLVLAPARTLNGPWGRGGRHVPNRGKRYSPPAPPLHVNTARHSPITHGSYCTYNTQGQCAYRICSEYDPFYSSPILYKRPNSSQSVREGTCMEFASCTSLQ